MACTIHSVSEALNAFMAKNKKRPTVIRHSKQSEQELEKFYLDTKHLGKVMTEEMRKIGLRGWFEKHGGNMGGYKIEFDAKEFEVA